MIEVQRRLARANNAVLSGLGIDAKDWEGIRDTCIALADVFVTDVRFGWEAEQGPSRTEVQPANPHPRRTIDTAYGSKPQPSDSLIEDSPTSPQILWRASESLIEGNPKSHEVRWKASSRSLMSLPFQVATDESTEEELGEAADKLITASR